MPILATPTQASSMQPPPSLVVGLADLSASIAFLAHSASTKSAQAIAFIRCLQAGADDTRQNVCQTHRITALEQMTK